MAEDKIYLLWSIDFYEHPKLEGVFKYFYRAEQRQRIIETRIDKLKEQWFINYDTTYEHDTELIEMDSTDWVTDVVEKRLILFRAKHKEMQIKHFEIEERELE